MESKRREAKPRADDINSGLFLNRNHDWLIFRLDANGNELRRRGAFIFATMHDIRLDVEAFAYRYRLFALPSTSSVVVPSTTTVISWLSG